MLSQSFRQVASLRSPTAKATTWRVARQGDPDPPLAAFPTDDKLQSAGLWIVRRCLNQGLAQGRRASCVLLSPEDDFFFRFGIASGLRVVTTAVLAVVTPVALLSLWSPPIADDLFASTVAAFESDCDHNQNNPRSYSASPLPKFQDKTIHALT